MENFEEKLDLIKFRLKDTLIELGGKAKLRQFGYHYRQNFGIVNLQVKRIFIEKFSEYLKIILISSNTDSINSHN